MPRDQKILWKSIGQCPVLSSKKMNQGVLNPHTERDFVQFGKTESVLNKGAKIALLFNPPSVLSLLIMEMYT